VPYQATSNLPLSPAPGQAKTLFNSPGVGSTAAADHVEPSSVDLENMRAVLPVTIEVVVLNGACSQIA
jgi:hypothetical protein